MNERSDPVDGVESGTGTWRVSPGNDGPSVVVPSLVGDALGRDPVDLPPLHEAIDADVLDGFVRDDGPDGARARLQFTYVGCEVTVYDDGEIALATPSRG